MPPIATIGNEGLMFFNVAIIDGIGGITEDNIEPIAQNGADGVSVISAIARSHNIDIIDGPTGALASFLEIVANIGPTPI
jgi:hypothetical protein